MAGILLPAGCCCGGGEPCEHCESSTPAQFTVVISDVDLCAGCYTFNDGASDRDWEWNTNPSPGVNGSYTLTQDPLSPCVFTWSEDATGSIHSFDSTDGSCTDFNYEHTIESLELRLEITATGMELLVYYAAGGLETSGLAFNGSKATSAPCGGTTVIDNDNENCGDGSNDGMVPLHAGGTATVEAV